MALPPIDFQVNRDDFRDCHFVPGAPIDDLAAGQVLFEIDRFALTSNNISYAAAGDMLNYWGFFPGPDRWGRIPAMAFGRVVASRNPDIPEGGQCFGFYPMSRHLVIDAEKNSSGMVDAVAHRAEHAPVYRTYSWTEGDPLYNDAIADELILLRGLFMTSFLCDDLIGDEDFYGASTSIVTSASSKTSIALGHLLAKRGRGPVVGLTSPRNNDLVAQLGCYDEVVLYDELDRLPEIAGSSGAVMVDMAGNGEVVAGVHERLGDELKYSCTVGATHWESAPRPQTLPGPQPEFFFAPGRIVKRTQDWGPGGLQERLGGSWLKFADWSKTWMNVKRQSGEDAVRKVYLEVLNGDLDPSDGHVLSLWD